MRAPTILISGASIAGPALAYWLNAQGWRTTVVERFTELREDGQNIRFPAGKSDSGGATAELEILRGQLSGILVDRTREDTEYVFGDQITAFEDGPDGVEVTFAHGPARTYDVVVVAEGLRSRTRSLLFPGVDAVRELGYYLAYLTIPRMDGDTDFWRWHSPGEGRSLTLRPDNLGTIRATLGFLSDVRGFDELGRDGLVTILRRTFADVGWEAPRVLAALEDAPLYFDAIGQARLPSWSSGRLALVGDAAYCSSPISGMSTSLALTGAYVLAGELAAHPHRTAFARYEALMRPYVDQAQKLPPGAPRVLNPRSRPGVAVMNTVVRLATTPAASRLSGLASRWFTPPADAIDLPSYPLPG